MAVEIYEKIVRRGLEKGLSEVEVYAVEEYRRDFTVMGERISDAALRVSVNMGIRGAMGKRVGSLAVDTAQVSIDEVLDKLVSVVKAAPEDQYWPGFPTSTGKPRRVKVLDKKAVKIGEEESVELIKHCMEKFKEPALSRGAERAIVVEGGFVITKGRVVVVNSHGVNRSFEYSTVLAGFTLHAEKTGSSADKSAFYARRYLDKKELERTLREEGERALLFLGSSPVESGVYDVVLEPTIAAEILTYSLAPAFSALEILEGRSPLKGREGQVVFSEKVTILDDPFYKTALGTRSIDDEGVATTSKPVVERGVLRGVLHSYYTARRTGSKPTGNGFRRSPALQPRPGFSNFVLKPVSGDLEEFTRDLKRGIVVYEALGYWMSDYATGTVKATVTHGLLVESGRVVKPVKGVVIGGNIYEWLSKSLVEVGKDARVAGVAGLGRVLGDVVTPSLWMSSVRVGGA
jgi:PmbA protein